MPEVTLTTFVDFVNKSGTPKATVVRNWKNKPDYDPRSDYYKQLRDEIVRMHRNGLPLSTLNGFLRRLTNERKQENYTAVAEGYVKWAKKHNLKWFNPQRETWSVGGLDIIVNPELGLQIDGARHFIKLYFKADRLAASRVSLITHLMHLAYQAGPHSDAVKSVLCLRDARLCAPKVPVQGLTTQVRAEAAYWMTLWPDA